MTRLIVTHPILALLAALALTPAAATAEAPAPSALHTALTAADRAVAEARLADAFLAVFTGGATGLPGMTQIERAAIAAALLQGDFAAASRGAWDYLSARAITRFAGSSAAAFLTAADLGQVAGRRAHDWAGEGRLQAEFARLGGLNGLQGWPRSYREALEAGFLGPVLDTRIRPVTLWLRDQDGGMRAPMSFEFYERQAYHLLLTMRDLEQGYRDHGLEGADRTPARLQAVIEDDIRRRAAVALGEYEALLWIQNELRESLARDRALAAARLAEAEARAATEAEARRAAEAEARRQAALAEEAARLAAEARAAAEARLAALPLEGTAEAARALLEAPGAGQLALAVTAIERMGADMTLFRLRLTNTGKTPLPALRIEAAPQRAVAGGGVAWSGGGGALTLAAGESADLSLVATGAIGAAVVQVAAPGGIALTRALAVDHAESVPDLAPEPDPPAPAETGLIDLPAVFRGESVGQNGLSVDSVSLTTSMRCDHTLTIEHGGQWAFSGGCSGEHPVVGATDPEAGVVTVLVPYPLPSTQGNVTGSVRVENGQTTAGWLRAGLHETFSTLLPAPYTAEASVIATPESVTIFWRYEMVMQTGGRTPQRWHQWAEHRTVLLYQP